MLEIVAGEFRFVARLEEQAAPETVAAFRRLLPLGSRIIHARWSGEACWIPFGELDVGLGPENATCYPNPGELVLYQGRSFKDYRGMGSIGAMRRGSSDRYFQDEFDLESSAALSSSLSPESTPRP